MISYFACPETASIFAPGGEPKLRAVSRAVYRADEKSLFAAHVHDDELELTLITKGEGSRLCGKKHYPVRQGDLVIHNSGVLHEENTERGDTVSYNCGVFGLRLVGLPENALLPEGESPVLHTGEHFDRVKTLVKMMYELLRDRPAGYAETTAQLARAYIALIAGLLEERRQGEAGQPAPADQEESYICERVKQYIDAHYAEPLTLQSISEAVRISPYYLSHVFKRETGYSPMQYVNHRRLGEAQTLLVMTREQVTEIALKTGFDTPNNFYKMFMKQVGMSPSRFRKAFFEAESTQDAED